MPIMRGEDAPVSEPFERVTARGLVGQDMGAVSLTVNELALEPQSEVPPHVHPTHEEAILILEGEFRATVGAEEHIVKPGDVVLAPQGVRHHLVNTGPLKGRIAAIFPTTEVRRQMVE